MNIVSTVSSYIKEFSFFFSELSIASLVAILTATALFVFAIRYGKDRMIALIFSLYISLLIYIHFPYTDKFSLFTGSDIKILLSNAIIFFAFVIGVYIIIERVIFTDYPDRGIRRFIEASLLSLAATSLLIAFAYNVLPIASFYSFAPPIKLLFSSSDFFFWWLSVPLLSILFLAKR